METTGKKFEFDDMLDPYLCDLFEWKDGSELVIESSLTW